MTSITASHAVLESRTAILFAHTYFICAPGVTWALKRSTGS
jgi:hypothetical protein